MNRHRLKTRTEYFNAVSRNKKNFELRKNDRDFQVGDILELVDYDGEKETGMMKTAIVSYVLPGGVFGLYSDYCILGMKGITSAFKVRP